MQQHTLIYFLVIQLVCISTFSQGFYDEEDVFVNAKTLSESGVCEVQAFSDYQGISSRAISNFVFKYEIDQNGIIEKRTYWKTPMIKKKFKRRWYTDRFMAISLVKDSIVSYEDGIPSYMQCSQSSIFEYDQFRSNTEEQMETMSNLIQVDDLQPNKYGISIISGEDSNLLIDTIILGHQLSIPKFLLKINDSICFASDSILSYYHRGKEETVFCITDSSTIRVEWLNNDGAVWRTYLFNHEGLLVTHKQGIVTTKYFYKNGLHIKTEIYQRDYLRQTTTFEYKNNCG